jgi:hypothetical protein
MVSLEQSLQKEDNGQLNPDQISKNEFWEATEILAG